MGSRFLLHGVTLILWKISGKIQTPFVIGPIIELGKCLNLIEPHSINIVKEAHNEMYETAFRSGEKMPVKKGVKQAA